MREGYLAVIASPWLWITILIFGLVNATSGGPMSVSLPFLVKKNLSEASSTLGLFTSHELRRVCDWGVVAGPLHENPAAGAAGVHRHPA